MPPERLIKCVGFGGIMNFQSSSSGLTRGTDTTGTHPGYMPGFGNDFETEARPARCRRA